MTLYAASIARHIPLLARLIYHVTDAQQRRVMHRKRLRWINLRRHSVNYTHAL